jgi:hypothetical protein
MQKDSSYVILAENHVLFDIATYPGFRANESPRHAVERIQYDHKSCSTFTPFHVAVTRVTAGSMAAPSCAKTKKAHAISPRPCVGLSSSRRMDRGRISQDRWD